MPFNQKILGAVGETVIISELMRGTSYYPGRCDSVHEQAVCNKALQEEQHTLQTKIMDWQESIETHTECGIFSFSGKESDLQVPLGPPEQWDIIEGNEEGSMQLD